MIAMTENEKMNISLIEYADCRDVDKTNLIEGSIKEYGVIDKSTGIFVVYSYVLDHILNGWYRFAGSSFHYCLEIKKVHYYEWTNEELALSISIDEEWEHWKLIELCKRAGMMNEWRKAWQAGDSEYEKVAYAAAEKLGVNIDRKDYLL